MNHIEIAKAQAREWGRIGGMQRKQSMKNGGYSKIGKAGAEKRWGKKQVVDKDALT
jgi:hypothetical protein